jgi:YVTN family beta-propeller protein
MTRTRRMTAVLLAATLAGTAALSAQQGPRLYVTNQDDATVSVIDMAGNKVLETIDLQKLGFPPTSKPHHAQVEPDGSFWYVTLIGAGKVLKFDRDNHLVGSVSMEVPGLLTLHPDQDLLVAARSMSAVNPPKRIALIRRSDMTLLDEVDIFFPRPHPLVTWGNYVYVGSLGVNQIASVRIEDGQLTLVDVDGPAHTFTQFAMSPDHRWLAVTASTSNRVLVFSLADPANPRLAREIPMEPGPFEPVFTYDGKYLIVTNLDANAVTFVDAATWEPVGVVRDTSFKQPHGIALSPDGRYVYVSNRYQAGEIHDHEGHKAMGSGNVVAICIPTRQVEAVMEVGHYAAGIGVPVPKVKPATPASCH